MNLKPNDNTCITMQRFARAIWAYMEKHGLTSHACAKLAGEDPGDFHNMLHNKAGNWGSKRMDRVAEALGTDTTELLVEAKRLEGVPMPALEVAKPNPTGATVH